MSCYTPKRKTKNGIEDVKLPMSSVNGLEEKLSSIKGGSLAMPIIRLAGVSDSNNSMVINQNNPLKFCIEIIDGALQVGDDVQICVRQLFNYKDRGKRKYKLRCRWNKTITANDIGSRFIFVTIEEELNQRTQRLYKTNDLGNSTFSPLYIRVRRPIFKRTVDVDGYFSNIITVWKKYNLSTGRILIK